MTCVRISEDVGARAGVVGTNKSSSSSMRITHAMDYYALDVLEVGVQVHPEILGEFRRQVARDVALI
jgi:hypothetical protein